MHVALRTVLQFLCVWSVLVSAAAAGQAEVKNRFALVIGNSAYQTVSQLPNAAKDAEDIADALVALQFKVYQGIDLNKAQFSQILEDFRKDSAAADTIVFYYAGHGFQLGKSNYLVPVDADLSDIAKIDSETQLLNNIINQIHGPKKQTVVLLDACRNNPLPRAAGEEGIKDGLAELQSGFGSYIAFATEPGAVSKDGLGANSPFARAILNNVATPKQSISDMMIAVRNEVLQLTGEQQKPWDQSSLRQQFYFNPNATKPINGKGAQWIVASAAPDLEGSTRSIPGKIEIGVAPVDSSWVIESTTEPAVITKQSETTLAAEGPAGQGDEDTRLVRGIQAHLLRLNCGTGGVDGKWGKKTRSALDRVSKKIGVALRSDSADSETLNSLETLAGPLCIPEKPSCKKAQRLTASGRCVAIASNAPTGGGKKPGGKKPAGRPTNPESSVGGGIGVGSFF